MAGVRALAVRDAGLCALPAWLLGGGSALHTLTVAGNQLQTLPAPSAEEGAGAPAHLAAVDLSRNCLGSVPPVLLRTGASLTALDLSSNQLEALPEAVGALVALRTLSVAHNALTELPRALGRLRTLSALDVSHNRLTRVPWGVLQAGPDGRGPALRLEGNEASADAMRLRARLASAPSLELEVCTAARPSFSLRGDRQRYLDCAEAIASAVRQHVGASIPICTNSGALRTVAELQGLSATQAKALALAADKEAAPGSRAQTPRAQLGRRASASEAHGVIRPPPPLMPDGCVEQYISPADHKLHRFPRVGALQVVVRARTYQAPGAGGAGAKGREADGDEIVGGRELYEQLYSKLDTGKFPTALSVVNALRAWLGQEEPLSSLDELSLLDGCEEEHVEEEEEDDAELNGVLAEMADRTRSMESVLHHKGQELPQHAHGDAAGAEERRLREAMQAYVVNG
mmetsp:Transcript_4492/g.11608  ORF Transcript_4492/g.11608 Transcript_4492/m.11608 type:complete len:459 (-) Transcript_4492:58-1434(-)